MTIECRRSGCPYECGTRRHPACRDRMLGRVLFLILAAVLLASMAVGLRDIHRSARSHSVIRDPVPVSTAELSHLINRSRFRNSAEPPASTMPVSTKSALSSGGACSRASRIALMIFCSTVDTAWRISSPRTLASRGTPFARQRPL